MASPIVSIIVACYNQEEFIDDTLNSVSSQSFNEWECIIIDDGSTDRSAELVAKYVEKDSRFIYYKKENGGVCSARNLGLKISRGKFILPLDADDIIGDGYLEKSVEIFRSYPETALVYCKAVFFGEREGDWDLQEFDYKKLLFNNHIFNASFYKREDVIALGGYDEGMLHGWEDWELWIRLLNGGAKVYRIDERYYFYRIKKESRSTGIDGSQEKSLQMRLRIFEQNHSAYLQYFSDPIMAYREMEQMKVELSHIRTSKPYRFYKSIKKIFGR